MTTSGKPREVCCLQIARQYRNAWGGWREHKHNLAICANAKRWMGLAFSCSVRCRSLLGWQRPRALTADRFRVPCAGLWCAIAGSGAGPPLNSLLLSRRWRRCHAKTRLDNAWPAHPLYHQTCLQ